ncbi:hypothetical protein OEA41_008504 [Lepraria neglecta]|uniref:Uncharacterized protein n=1 Tax=Lepraria neglecta TaxID=209136 RepID=A0AAD9ZHH6_9LECA|nr:hypothetical protein OEA41_008504 [Lepraria neglecta]
MMRRHFCKECEDYNFEYRDRVKAHFKNYRVETDHEYDPFHLERERQKVGREWAWLRSSDDQPFSREKAEKKAQQGKDEHSSRYGHSDSYDPFGEEWERIKAESQRGKNFRQQYKAASHQAEAPADMYAIIDISRQSSHDEIKRATREKRIATH